MVTGYVPVKSALSDTSAVGSMVQGGLVAVMLEVEDGFRLEAAEVGAARAVAIVFAVREDAREMCCGGVNRRWGQTRKVHESTRNVGTVCECDMSRRQCGIMCSDITVKVS